MLYSDEPDAQEAQITVNGGLALRQNLVRQRGRRRNARRVLVDVETGVEVGDARPLVGDQLIHRHHRPVIGIVEPLEGGAQRFWRQRLARLRLRVDVMLELGE